MTCASLAWHASGCTTTHFVDIGLMNAVIAFYPYRFTVSSLIALAVGDERRLGNAAAAGYVAITFALMQDATAQTDRYHEAFPTGRARYLSLHPAEIMLYIGLPGLYPVPFLVRMAQRQTWGCVPAMFTSVFALPLGFCFHALERLVTDVYCTPMSWFSQPTANFHLLTALAIIGAYIQSREVDSS